MHKKSTIAITSSTKELLELLTQHDLGLFKFVSRPSAITTDAAWIDDRQDDSIVIRLREGSESLMLPKPFHLRQIIDFLVRTLKDIHAHIHVVNGMELDSLHYTLNLQGQEVHLTEKEALLLQCLMEAHPHPVGKEALLENIWNYTREINSGTLQAHLYRLRQKLRKYHVVVQTDEDGYSIGTPE